jgi:hypothetical protein
MGHSVGSRVRVGECVVLGVALLVALGACGSASTAKSTTQASPTATATPTAIPAGSKVLFTNTLTPPPSDWTNEPATGCYWDGTGFHVKGTNNCGVPAHFQDETNMWQSADANVQVKQISGPTSDSYGIGLGYGVQYDRFDVQSDGKWAFLYCRGSNCTALVNPTASPAIHTGLGATNTLEVRVVAPHFDFYVNGTKVGQVDHNLYSSFADYMLFDGSDAIEVVYTNLTISTYT